MSAADALKRYYERQNRRSTNRKPTRKNNKPEHEVKKAVMSWLVAHDFSCDVVESKAVYSEKADRYIRGQATAGFSDIVGVCPCFGVACYIELKAPGRRSTLRGHQKDFLVEKIQRQAFACVTDSIEHLEEIYFKWQAMFIRGDYMGAKNLLLKNLPT